MKKIPTLFERDWYGDRSRVLRKVHPGCEWVLAGEGFATRKYDGVCCMFDGKRWFKRRELKPGQSVPSGWILVGTDPETEKQVGWVPIVSGPEDKHMQAAIAWTHEFFSETGGPPPFGTYEFLGPKSQGNVEGQTQHQMLWHVAAERYADAPRSFDGLCEWLAGKDIEGLVFHHEDGRMAKIKLRDFGLKRAVALAPAVEWCGADSPDLGTLCRCRLPKGHESQHEGIRVWDASESRYHGPEGRCDVCKDCNFRISDIAERLKAAEATIAAIEACKPQWAYTEARGYLDAALKGEKS